MNTPCCQWNSITKGPMDPRLGVPCLGKQLTSNWFSALLQVYSSAIFIGLPKLIHWKDIKPTVQLDPKTTVFRRVNIMVKKGVHCTFTRIIFNYCQHLPSSVKLGRQKNNYSEYGLIKAQKSKLIETWIFRW